MQFRLSGLCILTLFTLIRIPSFSQNRDELFIRDYLQPLTTDNIFSDPDYYNWGSSIIRDEQGLYHLFYARWRRDLTFTGWLTHSEIAHAVSEHAWGPWKYKETVLKGRGGDHWDAITAHNPKIKYFNGKYYLYYIGTHAGPEGMSEAELIETARTGYSHKNWWPLRENQRTGVAVAESLGGPWIRQDQPLIEPSGPITTLTVNPAVARGPDDKYYLIVKGDKPNETRFIRDQAIAISDHPDGPFVMQPKPVIDNLDTEDMSLWYDDKQQRFYGIFHAHSFIGMMASTDGINWKKATEYVVTHKYLRLENGDSIRPDRMERPFIYYEDGKPAVLSVAIKKGDDSYCAFIPIRYPEHPRPNPRQLAWQEAELGAVFHYDLHVFDGKKYIQGDNRITPIEDYQVFNPSRLDIDQWIRTIKEAGFKFALFTASHETGFAFYQSEVNPYSMRALNFQNGQGDLVRDFIEACRKYGIKPGIYLGIRWNAFLGVHDFKVDGTGAFQQKRQEQYNRMVEGMVKEICTNYGELFEIWFDGGADDPAHGAPDVLPIVQQYQPNCLFYHNLQLAEARWGGSESGTVNYPCWATFPYVSVGTGPSGHPEIVANNYELLKTGAREGQYWMPAMADAPLRGYQGRHEWFWEPGDEDHLFPVTDLMNMYEKSVGRNATLIMGLTPDTSGLLPEVDVRRLQEWGAAIRAKYDIPLYETSGEGNVLEIKFDQPTTIDRVVIQEDITGGEQVEVYSLEVLKDGTWKEVEQGTCIGHKRIVVFEPVIATGIRLKPESKRGNLNISRMAVYRSTY